MLLFAASLKPVRPTLGILLLRPSKSSLISTSSQDYGYRHSFDSSGRVDLDVGANFVRPRVAGLPLDIAQMTASAMGSASSLEQVLGNRAYRATSRVELHTSEWSDASIGVVDDERPCFRVFLPGCRDVLHVLVKCICFLNIRECENRNKLGSGAVESGNILT